MASLDILCSKPLNLKRTTKIEHQKIFCGPSKILKIIPWPVNICLKYFMVPTDTENNLTAAGTFHATKNKVDINHVPNLTEKWKTMAAKLGYS